MLRKLLIVPWYGPLPSWTLQWADSLGQLQDHGYDVLLHHDLADFKQRVQTFLGLDCPITPGSGKIHDFRPAFGILFARELIGYDFWGHTDMDCVYGRVTEFMPDERLAELDVYSDHTHYLCGPWALYRKTRMMADVFMDDPDWRLRLEEPEASGWVETGFTDAVNRLDLRTLYELNHGYQAPGELSLADGRLCEAEREISFFHFRHTKTWPTLRKEAPCLA